ncbi:hypothetical protein EDB19DRAFT_1831013 [Suillus lakei]|nr:hypothetical protein EDB19DRAFT_1831013 [Suillus lakei]
MDMIQSRELAMYPLAVVARMLDVFGENLGGGYDIGCQFKTTLNNSSLGPLVHSLHHTCLVGLGIKDLETCERTFSKSNSLASALHYASIFHHQQAIDSYFDHDDDFEVYGNLSNFLHSNYQQALNILVNGNAILLKVMQDLRVGDDSMFEYGILVEDIASYYTQVRSTRKAESVRCHAVEDYERNLKLVQLLECKLEVTTRWVLEDVDWQNVGKLIVNRRYQRALDHLEGLVVACIFELMKMNRAGTGYKLWKYIAKALQTCSVAIRSALNSYNAIASATSTPRQTLQWEEVVNYTFLADFDLLRNACADVCEDQLKFSSPALANQLAIHCNTRGWFNACHLKRLHNISMLPGFSGTLVPGLSMHTGVGESTSVPDAIPANVLADPCIPTPKPSSPVYADTHEDLDEEEEEEEEEEEIVEQASRNLQDILLVTDDFAWLGLLDDADVQ